ncbi:DUF4174 domain-containing protein [Telluribacter sp. SYSU D00476]|uniref:DUF4174 domain-containing protein n=1 Tax=Telluribacter sp. SYSU D00476 TaxID=2811430 RepID=UPI001FF3F7B5|nr:DUF4174 domain-containing protein [Telluribacter sp. SYSU D00476]
MKRALVRKSLAALVVALIALGNSTMAQQVSLPALLEQKQVWNEKLVIVYAPQEQQHLVKQQMDALHPYVQTLRQEKMVVVHIPTRLSKADRTYLNHKLHYQPERFNIWVIDEKGTLRMSGTKPAQASQLLRIINVQERPNAVAKAQLFW